MGDAKNPKPGDLVIDASDLEPVDLTPEQARSMGKVRDGFEAAVECLVRAPPAELIRAGIRPDDVARIADYTADRKRCESLLPACEKLVELLKETRIERGYHIAGMLTEAGAQVRRRAKRDPKGSELRAQFEPLLKYQYGPAVRAAARRGKAKTSAPSDQDTPAQQPAE